MMNPSKASSSSLVVALVMAIFLSSMLTLNAFSIQSAHHTFSSSRSFRPPLVIRDKQSLLFLSNNKSNNNIEDTRSVKVPSTTNEVKMGRDRIRTIIGGLATVGMMETGYLTYLKLFVTNGISNICGTSSGAACSSVLDSPYATIHFTNEVSLPLTAVGCIAYAIVAILSFLPISTVTSSPTTKNYEQRQLQDINENNIYNPTNNRLVILCTTTAMATFSTFLLSLLFNILHQSCPYCYLSAGLSISMASLAWFNGFFSPIPSSDVNDISAFNSNKEKEKNGLLMGLGSVVTSTVAALLLFLSVDEAAMTAYSTNNSDILNANGLTSNVVANAAAEKVPQKNIPAPPITASSSAEAMQIGQDLQSLDAKMFGAYWCSHCYDQKQRLGKEVFTNYVPYIECSKEGLNNQREMCEEKKIPGYPTWEIGGKLYPGEMYLDELAKIIQDARKL